MKSILSSIPVTHLSFPYLETICRPEKNMRNNEAIANALRIYLPVARPQKGERLRGITYVYTTKLCARKVYRKPFQAANFACLISVHSTDEYSFDTEEESSVSFSPN